jgi:hypothetical protein
MSSSSGGFGQTGTGGSDVSGPDGELKTKLQSIVLAVMTQYAAKIQRAKISSNTLATSTTTNTGLAKMQMLDSSSQMMAKFSIDDAVAVTMNGGFQPNGSTSGSSFTYYNPETTSSNFINAEEFTLKLAKLRQTLNETEEAALTKDFDEFILTCEFQGSTECNNAT